MIDHKDGHIPSPLIILNCTKLGHALQDWLKNNSVHRKASKSKLNVDKPDLLNYFNSMNEGGKNTSCCSAMGPKLICLAGIADKYIVLMNTWNTLPESYEQRVNTSTLATLKHQIQQAENTMPAMVTSMEGGRVNNAIVLHYLTSEVALEEPQIGSNNGNILIGNNCTDDKLHFSMPGGSWHYEEVWDKSDTPDAIPTIIQTQWAPTELWRFDLGTSDVDGYLAENSDHVDADNDKEESEADVRST